jgi:hypothetical protein
MQLINVGLVKNPLNWLTITLMLILAGVGGALVLKAVGMAPATAGTGGGEQ